MVVGGPVPSNGQVEDLNITREQGSGAVFAFQVLVETMMTLANEQFGGDLTQMPSLAVWWRPDQEWSCGACFHNVTLEVGPRRYGSSIFMTGNNLEGLGLRPFCSMSLGITFRCIFREMIILADHIPSGCRHHPLKQ